MITSYTKNNLSHHKNKTELVAVLEKEKLGYTSLFHAYIDKMKTKDPVEVERIANHVRDQYKDGEMTPELFHSRFHVRCNSPMLIQATRD